MSTTGQTRFGANLQDIPAARFRFRNTIGFLLRKWTPSVCFLLGNGTLRPKTMFQGTDENLCPGGRGITQALPNLRQLAHEQG